MYEDKTNIQENFKIDRVDGSAIFQSDLAALLVRGAFSQDLNWGTAAVIRIFPQNVVERLAARTAERIAREDGGRPGWGFG
jgi:hypothetical protein